MIGTSARGLLAATTAAALSLALSSCGTSRGSSGPSTATSSGYSGATRATVSVSGSGQSHVPNQVAARRDVKLINCGGENGGWSAGGTLKNSLDHSATYLITVVFTSPNGIHLASATLSVPVRSGESRLWSVAANFTTPNVVRCVLQGVATH